MTRHSRLVRKTIFTTLLVVCSNVAGNALLSYGLRGRDLPLSGHPASWVAAFATPWVAAGVGLLVLWLLARMALLSWADLSYVLPVTASGYVLTVLVARFLLAEKVPPARYAGSVLILLGICLVGGTPVRTTLPPRSRT